MSQSLDFKLLYVWRVKLLTLGEKEVSPKIV